MEQYGEKKLPHPYGEQKLVEELLFNKNQALDKIRQTIKENRDPSATEDFGEIIDLFEAGEFRSEVVTIIGNNIDLASEQNANTLQKIFDKLKNSKHIDFEKMDIEE